MTSLAVATETETQTIPISGVLIVEGVQTGDGRKIQTDALEWDDGPWSLMALLETSNGHDGATLVGRIETLIRTGKDIAFTGVLDAERGQEAARLIKDGMLSGISADLDDVDMVLENEAGVELTEMEDIFEADAAGELVMSVTHGRVRGGTLTPMPAFVEANVQVTASASSISVGGQIVVGDASARLPVPLSQLAYPSYEAFVAAGNKAKLPPSEWFDNPGFSKLTPLTITEDGQVSGHIAPWGQCHIGIDGMCITPPKGTDYSYFTSGVTEVWCESCGRSEEIPTGPITMGTGHAPMNAGKAAAVSHYDNTGTAVLDVCVGEDSYGIWVAGHARTGVTKEQLEALKASGVSGDWRRIGGGLELVAILAVNTPGYPVPRSPLAHVASGVQTALVTAPYSVTASAESPKTEAELNAETDKSMEERRVMRKAIADIWSKEIHNGPQKLPWHVILRNKLGKRQA